MANVLCVLYDDPADGYPPVLGDEGAGVVERVGPDIRSVIEFG